jgi:hypothetical protein
MTTTGEWKVWRHSQTRVFKNKKTLKAFIPTVFKCLQPLLKILVIVFSEIN